MFLCAAHAPARSWHIPNAARSKPMTIFPRRVRTVLRGSLPNAETGCQLSWQKLPQPAGCEASTLNYILGPHRHPYDSRRNVSPDSSFLGQRLHSPTRFRLCRFCVHAVRATAIRSWRCVIGTNQISCSPKKASVHTVGYVGSVCTVRSVLPGTPIASPTRERSDSHTGYRDFGVKST